MLREQYQKQKKNTNGFSQFGSEEVIFSLVVTRVLHGLQKRNNGKYKSGAQYTNHLSRLPSSSQTWQQWSVVIIKQCSSILPPEGKGLGTGCLHHRLCATTKSIALGTDPKKCHPYISSTSEIIRSCLIAEGLISWSIELVYVRLVVYCTAFIVIQ